MEMIVSISKAPGMLGEDRGCNSTESKDKGVSQQSLKESFYLKITGSQNVGG